MTDPYADYKAKYGPGPFVTCDAIITKGHILGTFWDIVLIKRAKDPYKGMLALPGGFMEADDPTIIHGAIREVEEETGLILKPEWAIGGPLVCDAMRRDPRARIIGVASWFSIPPGYPTALKAGSDALKDSAVWYDVRSIVSLNPNNLAFDHHSVITEILSR